MEPAKVPVVARVFIFKRVTMSTRETVTEMAVIVTAEINRIKPWFCIE